MVDSPTAYGTDTGVGGEVRGNYATLNPLQNGSGTLSNGNLNMVGPGSGWGTRLGTVAVSSGKWYFEATPLSGAASGVMFGITRTLAPASYIGADATGYGYLTNNGQKYNNSSGSAYGATVANNDVVGVAFDADAGSITFYKNGASQGVAFSSLPSGTWFLGISCFESATANLRYYKRNTRTAIWELEEINGFMLKFQLHH
jgi:hypothetical protein